MLPLLPRTHRVRWCGFVPKCGWEGICFGGMCLPGRGRAPVLVCDVLWCVGCVCVTPLWIVVIKILLLAGAPYLHNCEVVRNGTLL